MLGLEVLLRGQEPADSLDDDARLARAGPGDDHHGTVAVLDDRALLIRQRKLLELGGSRRG